ncbi:glycosyltransferase family 87 protein [Methylobacterium sp. WL116]|uniref:glycosyltransferase family 87 protein n=1 Tax=Methylobacterium sp. WL116 TaxID=2603889 RepID=UPI0011C92848|nr:glycosyltransferase family 87 protein [Methylobacterium sp. WL116]TXM92494.1 DUF2029 domain-containing protein [Methylobacterium sp. WL116]
MGASQGVSASERFAASLRERLADDAGLLRFARLAAAFLVPTILALAYLAFGTGPDPRHNWLGDVMGSDLAQVWVVGRTALGGRATEAYDLPVHLQNLAAAFGPECRFAWHYPPVFLLAASPLALLSPQGAFLVWITLSLAIFAAALHRATGRRDAVLIGLAHPLVLCNLAYGQNGLVTAGLLTLGAMLVDRRPWLAGLCFGLVAYKPQLAALAPFLLLMTGRRQALAACLATALALCLASVVLFGLAPWQAFVASLSETNRIILQEAGAGLDLNASAFGAVRLAGGSFAAAWTLQIGASLAALAVAWRVWAGNGDLGLRAATLLAAAPMVSPYVPVYDLVPLVPATILLAIAAHRAGGLHDRERALMLAAPFVALLRPAMAATSLPFGFLLGLATLACIAARALPRPVPRLGPAVPAKS